MENYLFIQQFSGQRKVFKITVFVLLWYRISITKYGVKIPLKEAYLQADVTRNTMNGCLRSVLFHRITNIYNGHRKLAKGLAVESKHWQDLQIKRTTSGYDFCKATSAAAYYHFEMLPEETFQNKAEKPCDPNN